MDAMDILADAFDLMIAEDGELYAKLNCHRCLLHVN